MHHKAVAHNLKGEEAMPVSSSLASGWFNKISLNGGINADTKIGNLYDTNGPSYTGENVKRMSLNNAFVNVNADVNDWTKAFVGLSYQDASANYGAASAANLSLEQGYVTLANASVTPAYLKIGKQFTNFGMYDAHALIQPMTTALSESLQDAITVGFDTGMTGINFYGSAYGLDDGSVQLGHSSTSMNGGARLGIGQTNDQLGWNLSADYLNNLTGVNNIATRLNNVYETRVGGAAINADINSGGFKLGMRYVQALTSFAATDIASTNPANGAKPYAANITAGYGFNAMNVDQNVSLAYDMTHDAVNLNLPLNRWTVGYDVAVEERDCWC